VLHCAACDVQITAAVENERAASCHLRTTTAGVLPIYWTPASHSKETERILREQQDQSRARLRDPERLIAPDRQPDAPLRSAVVTPAAASASASGSAADGSSADKPAAGAAAADKDGDAAMTDSGGGGGGGGGGGASASASAAAAGDKMDDS
jgi:hypothetical protein